MYEALDNEIITVKCYKQVLLRCIIIFDVSSLIHHNHQTCYGCQQLLFSTALILLIKANKHLTSEAFNGSSAYHPTNTCSLDFWLLTIRQRFGRGRYRKSHLLKLEISSKVGCGRLKYVCTMVLPRLSAHYFFLFLIIIIR